MSLYAVDSAPKETPRTIEEPRTVAPTQNQPESTPIHNIFFSTISNQLDAVKSFFQKSSSLLTTEASALINSYKKSDVEGKLLAEIGLKNAPNKEAYFQVLAQLAVYNTYENDHLLPSSELFTSPQYLVKKTIEYPEGIKIMVLTTNDLEETPLMIIRGTDPTNIHNMKDNLHKNIGALNTKQYKEELANELETLAIAHGRIHIMGHSYGGAVAQQLTSHHPDLISRCTRYNSPGVGKKVVKIYTANIENLPKDYSKPEIVSYRHAKDIASLLGGASLPTDPDRDYTAGSVDDAISHIDAHSFNTLSADLPHTNSTHSHNYYKGISTFLENCRNKLAAHVKIH